MNGDDNNVEKG